MSLEKIKQNILKQDNRCTDQPMFIVEKEVLDHGVDTGFASEFYYHDYDSDFGCFYEDSEEYDEYEELDRNGDLPSNVVKHGFKRRWEFVQAFFTEKGAQDYINIDGHNLGKTRIYGWGTFRNNEFREIRDAILKLDWKTPDGSPSCYNSNPSYSQQAENGCEDCDFKERCL